ncbi:MAG: hypothetical protein J6D87_00010 [Clostridia bacterium]|nr:hypothetical protein [Clostridia bacterium]
MKTCLFCGSEKFDEQNNCCVCHHSSENGTVNGEKVASYRRRDLLCPDYMTQFVLILIPAISMLFLGFLLLLAHFTDSFLFMELPALKNCYILVLLCVTAAAGLIGFGCVRFKVAKKAHETYCEIILLNDNEEQKSTLPLQTYYTYQRFSLHPAFLFLLIPTVLYPFLTSFCYYSANYTYLTVLNLVKITLPDVSDAGAFKFFMYVLPILAMICHLVDMVLSIVTIVRIKMEQKHALALNARTADIPEQPVEQYTQAPMQESLFSTQEETAPAYVPQTVVSDIPFAFEDPSAFSAVPVPHDCFKSLKEADAFYQKTSEAITAEFSLPELCKRLKLCLINHGVLMDEEQVMSLVSSLAAYRLVAIDIKSECRNAVLSAVAECFGCTFFAETASDTWESEQDLLWKETDAGKEASSYLQGLYQAQYLPNHVCTVALQSASPALSGLMQTFCAHSRIPEKACTLTVGGEDAVALPARLTRKYEDDGTAKEITMQLPKNAWCLITAPEGVSAYIPTEVLITGGAASVVLNCEHYDNGDVKYAISDEAISFGHFMEIVKQAGQYVYLSEDHWKKFDKLEEFLKSRIGFSFGNRLYRKIEIFTDTYFGCGGDVNHAIDLTLSNVLASVLSDHNTEALNPAEGKIGLFELMDKTFGSDNIPACHALLKAFGLEA